MNAREQLIKTRKKLNECVISSKRAEAAKEEVQASYHGGQIYKQVGRVFVEIGRDMILDELNDELNNQGAFKTQLKELDDRMYQRAEACNETLMKAEREFTEALKIGKKT